MEWVVVSGKESTSIGSCTDEACCGMKEEPEGAVLVDVTGCEGC